MFTELSVFSLMDKVELGTRIGQHWNRCHINIIFMTKRVIFTIIRVIKCGQVNQTHPRSFVFFCYVCLMLDGHNQTHQLPIFTIDIKAT
jgi:hypothetical protein